MKKSKAQMCPCGHERTWHTGPGRSCQYGHNHVMGGCSCLGYRSGRHREAPVVAPVVVGAATTVRKDDGLVAVIAATILELDEMRFVLEQRRRKLTNALTAAGVDEGRSLGSLIMPPPASPTHRTPASKPTAIENAVAYELGDVKLRRGERRILEVLARHHPTKLTRSQLGALTGIAGSGTTMGTYRGVLVRHGLIEVGGELVALTSEGLKMVGTTMRQPMTRAEIVAVWKNALRAGERNMLDAVISSGGEITRDELGAVAAIDPHGTTFGTYLGVLKRNDLVLVQGAKVRLGTALAEAS